MGDIKLTYKLTYTTSWVIGPEEMEFFFKTQDHSKILQMEVMRLRKSRERLFDELEPQLEVRIEDWEDKKCSC